MSSLLDLQPTLSHSAYSFASSTPTSSGDLQLVPSKSERRISLGVLDSAKFRLSHDVRSGLVPSSPYLPIPIRA